MAKRSSRYKKMERYMTYALIADALLFLLFMIFAGLGVAWLKIILAICAILLSGLCLAFLYITKELLRQRSFWISVGAAAILVCVLFSLILNFPSPNPYKKINTAQNSSAAFIVTSELL